MRAPGHPRRRAIAGAVVVMLVWLVAAAGPAVARPRPWVPDPLEWPGRVVPFVDFVEESRGFGFDHPVEVSLLSERMFDRRVLREGAFFGPDVAFDRLVGRLRALGLLPADPGSGGGGDDGGGGLLGYFDPYFEEVVVRGNDLHDPAVRTVLVHELAHALVSQRFRNARLGTGSFAVLALTEGDATAVEAEYFETLGPEAQTRVVEAHFSDPTGGPAHVLDVLVGAPYVLGHAYVELLDVRRERNAAFRDPPKADVEVIDPLRPHAPSAALELGGLPALRANERQRGRTDELGQLLVFLTLAARVDLETSLAAAIGWGDDEYRAFRRNQIDCLHLSVRGVTVTDTMELAAAFEQWSDAAPRGASTVLVRSKDVLVTTCETNAVADPVTDLSEDVGLVLTGRLHWSARSIDDGHSRRVARCVGNAMAIDPQVLAAARAASDAGRGYREVDDEGELVVTGRLAALTAQCVAVNRSG
jgi:hypothetical protein